MMIFSMLMIYLTSGASALPLEPVGSPIKLPYPNEQNILGVGGLSYDAEQDLWCASSENIAFASDNGTSDIALPRLFHMKLDFKDASVDFVLDKPVIVQPHGGLKLEDLAIVPGQRLFSGLIDPVDKDVWLVSESHSHLAKTSKFLSKDFGPTDLSSFDRDTFFPSRLVRVNAATGDILEEAELPTLWDLDYDWDSTKCVGERPFAGAHALSIVSSSDPQFKNIMFVAYQTALFQDGSSPTDFSGSATRILRYGLTTLDDRVSRISNTSSYLDSFRYDTSKLTLTSYQKGSSHFNALFGILAVDENTLLISECENLTGLGKFGQKIVNRIYLVYLDLDETVDHCHSLLTCGIDAPSKRLVWEREGDTELDGMSWGPSLDNGSRTIALTFENDHKIGLHFELFALDEEQLDTFGEVYNSVDLTPKLLKRRIMAVSIGAILLVVIFVIQLYWIGRLKVKTEWSTTQANTHVSERSPFNVANYALASAMLNSFLVGGLTFGYSGMVLMLRKEGIYAEDCSCGSFCAKQKEQLALISSVGFATAIGSRLFIGLFMDKHGPKLTAIICSLICLSGFSILASQSDLTSAFLTAWILLSVGGSGLHITGFHFTNLFPGDGKIKASAFISAAFGASSAIFPIMQVFNQYAGLKIRTMMIFYTAIVCLLTINNFLIQPWSKLKKGENYTPQFNIISSSWWKRYAGEKPTLSSITANIVQFEFYGETVIFSVLLLLLTHYLSTSSQLMYEKGDVPFTSNPNSWSDFMIARMAGWFNALGFIWLPSVKYIMSACIWPKSYFILCLLNIVIIGIVLVRSLELQILGFTLLSFGRLLLFSCHHAYLIDTFGMTSFGTLNGISSLVAAIIGFSSYPLQLLALRMNYAVSFIPVGVLIALTTAIPVIMWKKLNSLSETTRLLDLSLNDTRLLDLSLNESEETVASKGNLIMNWAETVTVDPSTFRYPENVEEVVSLVKSNDKIRCAGALHSCAPLISSQGIIMSLTKLDKIMSIDTKHSTVRCQSGVPIHEICEAIAPYNMAVGTLGTIDWQTISGAVMTGTHGGALTIPSLHTFVNSYTLVKPDGEIITVSKTSDPSLFAAMAPSMGVFGAVVEMEIECVPLEILEARMEVIEFVDVIDTFDELMKSNKYARVVVYPSVNKATIWTANPVSSRKEAVVRGAVNSPGYTNFRNENEKMLLTKYLHLSECGNFDEADLVLHEVLDSQAQRLSHYVGQYNHILCKERNNGIPHADIEFNFDFAKHKEVLREVKTYCDVNRVPYYNFEIRTTKQDDAMLSCCQGRDAMWIDFQAKASVSREFFNDIEAVLKPIGFRKHWAKGMDNTNPEYVARQFPQMSQFLKLMKEFDPDGKFRNTQGEGWFQMMDALFTEKT